jgi:AbrB family looped-hinge helix DNA binding protein
MTTGTLTAKGQTTIPKQLRDKLKLKPGDKLFFYEDNGRLVIRAKNRSVKDLKNLLPRPKKTATLEDIQDGIVRGALKSAGY